MPETDDYRYFDPKLLRGGASAAQQQQQAAAAAGAKAYQEAIVFVVGGGCFLEYHNLIDYCKVCLNSSPPWWTSTNYRLANDRVKHRRRTARAASYMAALSCLMQCAFFPT